MALQSYVRSEYFHFSVKTTTFSDVLGYDRLAVWLSDTAGRERIPSPLTDTISNILRCLCLLMVLFC